jgi:Raf kinase inhibitor-like YbhB/YbcL family protein
MIAKVWMLGAIATIMIGIYVLAANQSIMTKNDSFRLSSPAFSHKNDIPALYTCDNQDISPALSWINPPAETKSFVLICFDPDAPGKGWTHWIVYDIPSSINQLPEQVNIEQLPAKQGNNSWGKAAYGGPCPPQKKHRYFFTLYALDIDMLPVSGTPDYQIVMQAMKGHILGKAELMGKYQRQK